MTAHDHVRGQLTLGDDGIPTRAETIRTRKAIGATFEIWWARWPQKLGRKKDAALAWQKLITQGVTTAELHTQLDRYLEAFTWWNRNHPEHEQARQMHATTFLNSGRHDYEEAGKPPEVTADERWGHLARRNKRRTRTGRPTADVRPEEIIGSPEWAAVQRAAAR